MSETPRPHILEHESLRCPLCGGEMPCALHSHEAEFNEREKTLTLLDHEKVFEFEGTEQFEERCTISKDGKHWAVAFGSEGAYVDGVKLQSNINRVHFSPHGNAYAYVTLFERSRSGDDCQIQTNQYPTEKKWYDLDKEKIIITDAGDLWHLASKKIGENVHGEPIMDWHLLKNQVEVANSKFDSNIRLAVAENGSYIWSVKEESGFQLEHNNKKISGEGKIVGVAVSEDGSSYGYIKKNTLGEYELIVNGKPEFHGSFVESLSFSPSGKHFSFNATVGGEKKTCIDNTPLPYVLFPPIYSKNEEHFMGQVEYGRKLIVDDSPYTETTGWCSQMGFMEENQVWYVEKVNNKSRVVTPESEGEFFDEISPVTISPDGTRIAYVVTNQGQAEATLFIDDATYQFKSTCEAYQVRPVFNEQDGTVSLLYPLENNVFKDTFILKEKETTPPPTPMQKKY